MGRAQAAMTAMAISVAAHGRVDVRQLQELSVDALHEAGMKRVTGGLAKGLPGRGGVGLSGGLGGGLVWAPHRPHLSAVAVKSHESESMVPPVGVATKNDPKRKGGGYLHPHMQYAVASPTGVPIVDETLRRPGYVVPLLSLVVGALCMLLVNQWTRMASRSGVEQLGGEAVMRLVFERCDLSARSTVFKLELARQIKAVQGNGDSSPELDRALPSVQRSPEEQITWDRFRGMGFAGEGRAGAARGLARPALAGAVPATLEPSLPTAGRGAVQRAPTTSSVLARTFAAPGAQGLEGDDWAPVIRRG